MPAPDEIQRESDRAGSKPLPLDFVDFVCAVRGIDRALAVQLLREFVASQLQSPPRIRGPGIARAVNVTERDVAEPFPVSAGAGSR